MNDTCIPADAGYTEGAAVEEGVEVAVEAAEEVAGAQEISKNRPGGGKAQLTYKAVNAAKVGAQSSTTTFAKNRIEARGNMYPDESSNNTLLFFLAA